MFHDQDVALLAERIIGWRREFHRHPELAGQEHWTAATLRAELEALGLPTVSCGGTGLRAVLAGQKPGRRVALRADMDALPIQEVEGRPYGSTRPGVMHACGHDGHMAALLGAAHLLAGRTDALAGEVVYIFQPAEELPPGGATAMIEEGVLDGVDAVFGLHLWQSLPTNRVGLTRGVMMAQGDKFRLTVHGRGGHGSMPHQTVDPILVAAQLVVHCQSIVSRSIDPLKPAVVSFGSIHGGTVFNVIPPEVTLTGTVRTLEEPVQKVVQERLERLVEDTCRAYGAQAELSYEKGYPPLLNHPAMADLVLEVARETLGTEQAGLIDPVMGGEDFTYYLRQIPGAFFFYGAGDGMPHPHHHPGFDLDEKALPGAACLLANVAWRFLG